MHTFSSVRGTQGVAIDALLKRGAIEELHLRVLCVGVCTCVCSRFCKCVSMKVGQTHSHDRSIAGSCANNRVIVRNGLNDSLLAFALEGEHFPPKLRAPVCHHRGDA